MFVTFFEPKFNGSNLIKDSEVRAYVIKIKDTENNNISFHASSPEVLRNLGQALFDAAEDLEAQK